MVHALWMPYLPHWLQVYVLLYIGIGSIDVEIVRSVALRNIDLLDYIMYFCVNDHDGPWNTHGALICWWYWQVPSVSDPFEGMILLTHSFMLHARCWEIDSI